jgi:hypothetical protein
MKAPFPPSPGSLQRDKYSSRRFFLPVCRQIPGLGWVNKANNVFSAPDAQNVQFINLGHVTVKAKGPTRFYTVLCGSMFLMFRSSENRPLYLPSY